MGSSRAMAQKKKVVPIDDHTVGWKNLAARMKRELIGQDDVINELCPYLTLHKTGLSPEGRPVGNFLLLGPTGTGKTRLGEVLAKCIHGHERMLIRIDCGEYQMEHEVAKLIGCFSPDTPILMGDGSRKTIEGVKQNDLVLAKDGKPHKVLQTYEYDCDGDILEIKIAGNSEPVKVTGNHLVWAKKGRGKKRPTTKNLRNMSTLYTPDGLDYIQAKDLEVGDIVTYPRFNRNPNLRIAVHDLTQYMEGSKFTFDNVYVQYNRGNEVNRFVRTNSALARIIGYFLAEGHTDGNKVTCFTFSGKEQILVDNLKESLIYSFGDKITISEDFREPTSERPIGRIRVTVHSKVVTSFIEKNCNSGSDVVKIPEWLLHESDEILWEMLDAMFMGDGGKTVNRRLDYSTISPNLASQTEMLIKSLGYICQVQRHTGAKPEWNDRYRLYVSGAQFDSFISNLRMTGQAVRPEWTDDMRKTSKGIQRNQGIDDNYVYSKIVSIKSIPYSGKVYDFSVEDKESYVVAMAVHNSPPGYLGHRETQPIFTQQKLNAIISETSNLSIVVFDEIEKAAPSLIKMLLGVLDKAVLRLGDNTSVNFERSIILMTSNMGASELKKAIAPDFGYSTFAPIPATSVSKMNTIGNLAAKRRLPPEFMNRIDQIFTFKTLSRENIEQILAIELGKIESHVRERLELPGFELILHEDAIDWIVDNGFSQEYGGRNLKRLLHKRVLYPIAQSVEAEEIEDGDVASFTVSDGDLQYQVL